MPYKDPEVRREKQKEYKKRYYEKNKQAHMEKTRLNKAKHKEKWNEFKATLKCATCGFQHIAAIDFHHTRGRDTSYNSVNTLVKDGRFAAAYREIKKCIPLCSNCHRIFHWKEAQEKAVKRRIKRKKARIQADQEEALLPPEKALKLPRAQNESPQDPQNILHDF